MTNISRRTVIRSGLAAGAMLVATSCKKDKPSTGPIIITNSIKDVTLRLIGTGAAQINDIKVQAEKELGFKLQLRALSTEENNQIAITQPKQYDMFDGEYFSLPLVFPSGNLQPLEVKRIKNWDKIVSYFTTGKFDNGARVNNSQGTAPFKVMYVKDKDSKEFSATPTAWATLIPFQYNADTLGYRPDLTGKKIESWAELLDSKFKGKTALLDIPSIGIMDAAMVVEAAGMMKFGDKGNMTRAELDQVSQMLIKLKKDGQFRAFWKTFDESVNLMSSGEVALQSMWSPAVTAVKSKGIQCTYASLKEGYRGWGGGIGLSRNLSGISLDAAYEYLNWMLDGWVGAFLSRQGYYSAAPETARKFMKPEEWDYWYEGKPAAIDILDPFGKKIDAKGAVRDGGSFKERFSNIVCWNSVMKEQTYLIQKWNEFVAA